MKFVAYHHTVLADLRLVLGIYNFECVSKHFNIVVLIILRYIMLYRCRVQILKYMIHVYFWMLPCGKASKFPLISVFQCVSGLDRNGSVNGESILLFP